MARVDTIVLGAGIVGTSIAVHLAKRGVAVALVDRGGPGEGTSYGNTGIIEGNTIFPAAFPSRFSALLRVALKRAPEANYHLTFLPKVAPWLLAFRAASQPERLIETAHLMRPLMARAVAEHEALSAEAGADKISAPHRLAETLPQRRSRSRRRRASSSSPRSFGIANVPLDGDAARALEPSLKPVFRHAVHWTGAVSVSNPLALTRAYAARFAALGGLSFTGDARTLHRAEPYWRVDTAAGPLDAGDVVVALGPWTPDLIEPLGIKLPLAVKRGYHWHFRPQGNAGLSRPILDAENGYCPRADGAGHPAHHRRRIRRARCAADAGAIRSRAAEGARIVRARRRRRAEAVDGIAAVLRRFPPGDCARAQSTRPMARLWPRPLGPVARPGDRAAHCRDDDRRDAVLRSGALRGGAVSALAVIASSEATKQSRTALPHWFASLCSQ